MRPRLPSLAQRGYTDDDAPPTVRIVAESLAEADLIRQSYFDYLTRSGGPVSAKGRMRRCVEGWSKAADRCHKLAMALGLERHERHLDVTPAEYVEAQQQKTAQEADVKTD